MSWRRVLAAVTMVLWSLPIGAKPQSAEAPGAETEITLPPTPTMENLEAGVRSQRHRAEDVSNIVMAR